VVPGPGFTVGAALDGAGWHPSAWREPSSRATELFSAGYWSDLAATAEDAGLHYLTIEDSLHLRSADQAPPGDEPAAGDAPAVREAIVEGRLDALLVASWIAPRTRRIGLIPTATTTHTEPFHVATALQTLDFVSLGRAGWQLRFSGSPVDAAAFGRKPAPRVDREAVLAGRPDPGIDELVDEAADVAEVARRLWDSWEDDAIIRDVASGRFLDRDRIHHIDFEGERFSVVGPSIVPRSPQGQLPITLLAHAEPIYALAARAADVVFVTPDSGSGGAGAPGGRSAGAPGDRSAAQIVAAVRDAERAADRPGHGLAPLRIVADLVIGLDAPGERATDRLSRLDELAGSAYESDARVFVGDAGTAADLIDEWRAAGVEGVRLRPLSLPADLEAIGRDLLPVLRERGLLSRGPGAGDDGDLRSRFGLGRATNRYAHAAEVAA